MYAHVVSRLFVYFYVASPRIWRRLRFAPPIFFSNGSINKHRKFAFVGERAMRVDVNTDLCTANSTQFYAIPKVGVNPI